MPRSKKAPDDSVTKLSQEEMREASDRQHIGAKVVYETVRREGEEELARPLGSLVWSGVAAGLGISFSVVTEGLLHAFLPDAPWRPLVENLGYCVGFLIVILARQQLFTENTITVILPLLARPSRKNSMAVVRLWCSVFAANIVGTTLFALVIVSGFFFSPEAQEGMRAISLHLMENDIAAMFFRGIVAGWLIATLVWLLPSAEGCEFVVIVLLTYLIALADLTHVVAGSVEAFLLVMTGDIALSQALFGFLVPTFLGNVVGGTALFAMISYAQVRKEI